MSKKLTAKMPDGRIVYGAAAQQRIIKENGGWEEHHRKFAEIVIDNAIREFEKFNSKKNFRVLKGKKTV